MTRGSRTPKLIRLTPTTDTTAATAKNAIPQRLPAPNNGGQDAKSAATYSTGQHKWVDLPQARTRAECLCPNHLDASAAPWRKATYTPASAPDSNTLRAARPLMRRRAQHYLVANRSASAPRQYMRPWLSARCGQAARGTRRPSGWRRRRCKTYCHGPQSSDRPGDEPEIGVAPQQHR